MSPTGHLQRTPPTVPPTGRATARPSLSTRQEQQRVLRVAAGIEHLARVECRGLRGLLGFYRIELAGGLRGTPAGPPARVWYFRYGKALDFLLALSAAHDAGWEDRESGFDGLQTRRTALGQSSS